MTTNENDRKEFATEEKEPNWCYLTFETKKNAQKSANRFDVDCDQIFGYCGLFGEKLNRKSQNKGPKICEIIEISCGFPLKLCIHLVQHPIELGLNFLNYAINFNSIEMCVCILWMSMSLIPIAIRFYLFVHLNCFESDCSTHFWQKSMFVY